MTLFGLESAARLYITIVTNLNVRKIYRESFLGQAFPRRSDFNQDRVIAPELGVGSV